MQNRLMTALVMGACMNVLGGVAQASTDQGCAAAPKPVVSLDHGSRYIADDSSRSIVDPTSNADVNAQLKPIDAFIRSLVQEANSVLAQKGDPAQSANCVVAQLAHWARADALSDLKNLTANFSVGSRLAGFAFAYAQVRPYANSTQEKRLIEAWLLQRAREQMAFWEEDATPGSKRGNLRAWATLAINLAGYLTKDDSALRWSAWSATFLQCQALEDGSLPQEMKRGKYALHYQLHAIAPLVVTTLLLERQGLSIRGVCDDALIRIVRFAMSDLETGEKSQAYSGKPQSYFDGSESLEKYQLAWLEAYLLLHEDAGLTKIANGLRPLSHSKLGGRQDLLWQAELK
ncbi:alginate lyase family protein [Shimia sp.]|uniref:alginate lyase family protein n=1 Tax=Shimia sp. TaxID=1954381 RepID=UPI003BA96B63